MASSVLPLLWVKRWPGGNSFHNRKLRKWNKVLWLNQRNYRLLCICSVQLSGNSTCGFSFSASVGRKNLVEVPPVRPHSLVSASGLTVDVHKNTRVWAVSKLTVGGEKKKKKRWRAGEGDQRRLCTLREAEEVSKSLWVEAVNSNNSVCQPTFGLGKGMREKAWENSRGYLCCFCWSHQKELKTMNYFIFKIEALSLLVIYKIPHLLQIIHVFMWLLWIFYSVPFLM